VQVQLGRHPGIRQPLRIGDVLVAEDVEVADVEIGVR